MGAWGDLPWENDGAAVFFNSLFPPDFHDKVVAGLRSEYEEEVRAAAWVVLQLAHSAYVWQGDGGTLREVCGLAADKLEELATDSEEGEEFWDWDELRREAAELRARRHRPLGQ